MNGKVDGKVCVFENEKEKERRERETRDEREEARALIQESDMEMAQGFDPGVDLDLDLDLDLAQQVQQDEAGGLPIGLRMAPVTQNFAGLTTIRTDPRHELVW